MRNIYYFTDIHGQYRLCSAILDYLLDSDPDCSIIYGGDACDRGPDGYKIMLDLLSCPNIGYLKGNHEQMFVYAAREFMRFCAETPERLAMMQSKEPEKIRFLLDLCERPDVMNYYANDGASTLYWWLINGADRSFVDTIDNLPLTFSYNNLDFCHAGSTYSTFMKVAEAEYNGAMPDKNDADALLWDRTELALGWETGRIAVFGHTPTLLLPQGIYGRDKKLERIHPCAWYDKMQARDKRGGLKIDMDTGATWTGRAFVLNCLTMEVMCFYDEGIPSNKNEGTIEIIEKYQIIDNE